MQTIERNDQVEDQTMDEKGSPSSEASNSSKAETKSIKPAGKLAVKKKAAKKAVRKKAATTAGGRLGPAKKKTLQTSRKEVQNEESDSSKAKTKQIVQPRKVAAKKKTARKKAAKPAGSRADLTTKTTSQTSRKEVKNKEPGSSKEETKQLVQPRKVAVKKKTARKKAAKPAGSRRDSTTKATSQASRKVIQAEPPAGSDRGASVTGGSEVRPAEQNPPEKPVAGFVSPATVPQRTQPLPSGGTGLRGFWIKVGAAGFVILAGVIGIYSYFSEDEATSGPEATQMAAGTQGEAASVADSAVAATGTNRGVIIPPATEQSNVVYPESLHGHSNEAGTFAGAAVANEPVVETAITAGVPPGVTPAADQAQARPRDSAASTPYSGRFSEESTVYRPELYRPLEPEQDPPQPTQPSAVSETPRNVPAPSYYPQPGAYPYPQAPYYGGYGRYRPY